MGATSHGTLLRTVGLRKRGHSHGPSQIIATRPFSNCASIGMPCASPTVAVTWCFSRRSATHWMACRVPGASKVILVGFSALSTTSAPKSQRKGNQRLMPVLTKNPYCSAGPVPLDIITTFFSTSNSICIGETVTFGNVWLNISICLATVAWLPLSYQPPIFSSTRWPPLVAGFAAAGCVAFGSSVGLAGAGAVAPAVLGALVGPAEVCAGGTG